MIWRRLYENFLMDCVDSHVLEISIRSFPTISLISFMLFFLIEWKDRLRNTNRLNVIEIALKS